MGSKKTGKQPHWFTLGVFKKTEKPIKPRKPEKK
jgi:hypothetical protein